jgi:hypothetical protein
VDNECEFSNQMAVDVMFKVVNLKDGLSKEEASFMGRGHGHALMRFEWVEIIIRLGIAKFFESGVTQDPSNAVEMLCNNHILPHLEIAATHQRNDFRKDRLYNEPVDIILKSNKRIFEYIFGKRCALKPTKNICMDMRVSWNVHANVLRAAERHVIISPNCTQISDNQNLSVFRLCSNVGSMKSFSMKNAH